MSGKTNRADLPPHAPIPHLSDRATGTASTAMPAMPAMPDVSDVPDVPDVPAMSDVSYTPAMPNVPDMSAMPDLPDVPAMSYMAGLAAETDYTPVAHNPATTCRSVRAMPAGMSV
jgi:hypothetical protein